MSTDRHAYCSIYENRPEVCRVYPKVDHWIPSVCTYYFQGEERKGSCDCGIGACCAEARAGGEPGGAAMPGVMGGEPCKYLAYRDGDPEKTASEKPQSGADQESLLRIVEFE